MGKDKNGVKEKRPEAPPASPPVNRMAEAETVALPRDEAVTCLNALDQCEWSGLEMAQHVLKAAARLQTFLNGDPDAARR